MTGHRAAGLVALSAMLAASTPAHADAPAAAARVIVTSDAEAAAVLARLAGHRAHRAGDRIVIDDVAGDGRPWVGVVERRGRGLWLVGDGFALELRGALARPRVAGPGYRLWVTGAVAGARLTVRRLGVLAPPPAR